MPDIYDQLAESAKTGVLATATDQVTALAKKEKTPLLTISDQEAVLLQGDLERMSTEGRLAYYLRRCEDLGLDPLSRPFDYIRVPIQGVKGAFKTIMYANRNCCEQLRSVQHLSSEVLKEITEGGIYKVFVRCKKPIIIDGHIIGERTFDDLGAVGVAGLGGLDLANAMKKAHTQGHRRATLGMCGLGMSDESETSDIRGAIKITPDEIEPRLLTNSV